MTADTSRTSAASTIGFHYNDLQAILEAETTTRDSGSLLITNLWNRSTPFIRYEIGDVVELSDHPCPCGAPFPLITKILGRTADILTFADGTSLNGPALTLIFQHMKIDGWQVVQKTPTLLEVRLCSPEIPQSYTDHIRTIMRGYLSQDVTIAVKRVERARGHRSGKTEADLDGSQTQQ